MGDNMKNGVILMFPEMANRKHLESYPNRIREWREAREMTQEQLGDAIGLTKVQISRMELGSRGLLLEWMQRIAVVLEVTTADLLKADDNPLATDLNAHRLLENYQLATDEGRRMITSVAETAASFRHGDKIVPFSRN